MVFTFQLENVLKMDYLYRASRRMWNRNKNGEKEKKTANEKRNKLVTNRCKLNGRTFFYCKIFVLLYNSTIVRINAALIQKLKKKEKKKEINLNVNVGCRMRCVQYIFINNEEKRNTHKKKRSINIRIDIKQVSFIWFHLPSS